MMIGKPVVALATLALAGCVHVQSIMLSDDGASYIGKTAATLLADKGAAEGRTTSREGATVYVYKTHDLAGTVVCKGSFFVRNGTVVGFQARGIGLGCSGSTGNTT